MPTLTPSMSRAAGRNALPATLVVAPTAVTASPPGDADALSSARASAAEVVQFSHSPVLSEASAAASCSILRVAVELKLEPMLGCGFMERWLER
jgi:hypothetical protein